MLEQTPKSSRLSAQCQKLHVDFYGKPSMGGTMTKTDEELDPVNVRTRLFAIITAMLEGAHDASVKGQSYKSTADESEDCIANIRLIRDEVNIQRDAAEVIAKL